MDIRVGHGYDLHRLVSKEEGGKNLVLGGISIESNLGPIAHSDGDAVIHAVTDAILSAIGEPDIGTLYPNNIKENKDRDSADFLSDAVMRANSGGWAICNIDVTVLCDEPKISKYRKQICNSLCKLIGAPLNIKGKTYEGTCNGAAIEVHVVALVQRGTQQ
jgi:2-C-methyl-D-erythritol 2,4-cyclodiphosphate synthase